MTKRPNINDMNTARDWAAHIISAPFTSSPMEAAAARVILHAIPAPPPPTLADMTDAEQEACGGMQADLAGGGRAIILYGKADSDGLVQVLEPTLDVFRPRAAQVTPRPDLPRFVWPDDTPATESSTVVRVGDLIESADDPRLAALPVGSVLLDVDGDEVEKTAGRHWKGDGFIPYPIDGDEYGPWTVHCIGKATAR